MTKKDCDYHRRHRLYRRVFCFFLTIVILVLLVILIVWLVLRPSKPKFYLQDTTVHEFNLTDPNFLTTMTQITVSSHNPNDRIGIYYDNLDAFIMYQNQQITVPTALPPGYQGHNDVTIWSPYIYGTDVPVAPYLTAAVGQDENAGFILLYIKIEGRLRWKVGTWISGGYHIDVGCPAFLTVTQGNSGGAASFQFQHLSSCSVDV